MQWDSSRQGGFTTGEPWLPVVNPAARNVTGQREDSASLLAFYRDAIALRRELGGETRMLDLGAEAIAFERGRETVLLNLADEPCPIPAGEVLLASAPTRTKIPPHAADVLRG